MRILVDINHPHQVHLFRNAIRIWRERGHEVLITARDKDITSRLLDFYGLNYQLTGRQRNPGLFSFALGVLESDIAVWRAAIRFKPDWMIGTSFAIAHISRLLPGRSVVFAEDSFESTPMFWRITAPFADFIVTPSALEDDFAGKHLRYEGYQELAYLHPNRFTPEKKVLTELKISPNKPIFIMRFVSLKASHDIGQRGLSDAAKQKLVNLLSSHGTLFITSEEPLIDKFADFQLNISPEKIHHLLAFSSLLLSDSQSMTIEAAVLAIPSVRCNTFVGRTPVIEELEKKYGLTFGFQPTEEEALLAKVEEIIAKPQNKKEWHARRDRMLKDKIDLTAWIVDLPERLH